MEAGCPKSAENSGHLAKWERAAAMQRWRRRRRRQQQQQQQQHVLAGEQLGEEELARRDAQAQVAAEELLRLVSVRFVVDLKNAYLCHFSYECKLLRQGKVKGMVVWQEVHTRGNRSFRCLPELGLILRLILS